MSNIGYLKLHFIAHLNYKKYKNNKVQYIAAKWGA